MQEGLAAEEDGLVWWEREICKQNLLAVKIFLQFIL